MAHTPGPWHAAKHFQTDENGVPINAHGLQIAVSKYLGGTDQSFDNAKLIAAAPELLEALKNVLDWAVYDEARTDKCIDAVHKARSAIKKATE